MADQLDYDFGPTIRGFASGQKVFHRYTLVRLLGRGGMGVVWLARDDELEREVALKFLPELLASDASAITELKRETRRSLELTHPNIVRVYDFVQDDALAAISMEYIDGRTLADLRGERALGAFDPDEIKAWVGQLCEALHHAHADAHVVHRDLKPANIMVDERGRIKITDFGISATVSETVTRVTQVTSTSGTMTYMSPQQMLGRAPTPSDDIYSLGALLYELLTSRPPFFRGNIALQVERETPPTLADRRTEFEIEGAEVPPPWQETISACLAKDPAERPASASAVASGLFGGGGAGIGTNNLVGAGQPAPSGSAAKPGSPPSATGRSRRWIAWVAIVLLLFGGAGGGYFYYARVYLPAERARAAEQRVRDEKAKQELAAHEAADRKAEQERIAAAQKVEDERQAEAERVAQAQRDTAAAAEELARRAEEEKAAEATRAAEAKTEPSDNVVVEAQSETPPPAPPPEFVVEVVPPVAGARVWLGSRADLGVGPDGRLVLRDVPLGTQDLMVQAPGYQPFLRKVEISEDGGSARVTLSPLIGSITVRARPGTRVTATDSEGHDTIVGTVDANGVLTNGNTLPIGRYHLRFENDDCAPVEMSDVELVSTRTIQVAPTQPTLPGELRVLSIPSGADVSIDGVAVGRTPLTLRNQPSEVPLHVAVSHPGYHGIEHVLTIKPREASLLDVGTLDAEVGSLRLRFSAAGLDPAKATIRIDDREKRGVPDAGGLRIDGLSTGTHSVEIEAGDFEPWRQDFAVSDQETTVLDVAPQLKPARLRLRVTGPDQYALKVDGRPMAVASGAVTLSAETDHSLELSATGYRLARRTVRLAPNATESWNVEMLRLDRPADGEPYTVVPIALDMVWVPAGEFVMGSPRSESGPDSDERPETHVRVTHGFWLGAREVTQGEWMAVMRSNPSYFRTGGSDAPVESVSWNDAMAFCRALTTRERAAGRLPRDLEYTLPTEAQWEYACRAGTTGPYAGNLSSIAWTSQRGPQPVGKKRPNAWGLYDMHGNVSEWTLSWYGDYPGGDRSDFAGPSRGRVRVFRGGDWHSSERSMRSAYRNWVSPDTGDYTRGFRLALVHR